MRNSQRKIGSSDTKELWDVGVEIRMSLNSTSLWRH